MSFAEPLSFFVLALSALFPVVNPVGNSVFFLSLTNLASSQIRRQIARKIAANAFVVMLSTLLVGFFVLKLFGIGVPIVQTCGGILILTLGWKELNSNDSSSSTSNKEYVRDEVEVSKTYDNQAFYPFTFPMTVGPGTMATVLTLGASATKDDLMVSAANYTATALAMLAIALVIYITYSYSDRLVNRLTENLRKVVMRLLAFILFCIGGQITANGLWALYEALSQG